METNKLFRIFPEDIEIDYVLDSENIKKDWHEISFTRQLANDEFEERKIEFTLPRSIKDGDILEIDNEGHDRPTTIGDLYITIHFSKWLKVPGNNAWKINNTNSSYKNDNYFEYRDAMEEPYSWYDLKNITESNKPYKIFPEDIEVDFFIDSENIKKEWHEIAIKRELENHDLEERNIKFSLPSFFENDIILKIDNEGHDRPTTIGDLYITVHFPESIEDNGNQAQNNNVNLNSSYEPDVNFEKDFLDESDLEDIKHINDNYEYIEVDNSNNLINDDDKKINDSSQDFNFTFKDNPYYYVEQMNDNEFKLGNKGKKSKKNKYNNEDDYNDENSPSFIEDVVYYWSEM